MKENQLSSLEQKMLNIIAEEARDETDPEWKYVMIDGNETKYVISNVGDVINTHTGTMLTPLVTDQGYCVITIYHDSKQYTVKVHRLVAIAFVPNPLNKPEVNHLDGNKQHNWYKNLEWATSKENKQHGIKLGLYDDASFMKVGVDRPNVVYTEQQVHAVCKLLEQGKQAKEISELLHVPASLPASIKYCGKWKHISSQYAIPKVGPTRTRRSGVMYVSKKNSHEQIHQICKLLEQGKQPKEISELLGVSIGLPSSIKSGHAWGSISKGYKIPRPIASPRSDDRPKVIELLTAGVADYGEILRKLGLPDDRVSRKYIALVKFQLKDQSSTTIENVIGSDENRSDDK